MTFVHILYLYRPGLCGPFLLLGRVTPANQSSGARVMGHGLGSRACCALEGASHARQLAGSEKYGHRHRCWCPPRCTAHWVRDVGGAGGPWHEICPGLLQPGVQTETSIFQKVDRSKALDESNHRSWAGYQALVTQLLELRPKRRG